MSAGLASCAAASHDSVRTDASRSRAFGSEFELSSVAPKRACTSTSASASAYGSGRNTTASAAVRIVVVAPIPSASVPIPTK